MNEQQRAVVQQALEAMEVASSCVDGYYLPEGKTLLLEVEIAITALRQLLEQPTGDKLSPTDAQPAVQLTDDDWQQIADETGYIIWSTLKQAIEAKLREKNGY